jgi:hypothetical protein
VIQRRAYGLRDEESPTRAALLKGRNHHSAHTGTIMEHCRYDIRMLLVMQSAEDRDRDNGADPLDRSPKRRILL